MGLLLQDWVSSMQVVLSEQITDISFKTALSGVQPSCNRQAMHHCNCSVDHNCTTLSINSKMSFLERIGIQTFFLCCVKDALWCFPQSTNLEMKCSFRSWDGFNGTSLGCAGCEGMVIASFVGLYLDIWSHYSRTESIRSVTGIANGSMRKFKVP